ncbi:beta-glucuronosyltransferase GlcAT14A-like isoform X2 [Camellia sinensis]|uniref:beta-glucuronosyltransferase GlcAT14A-like isoform X2 n=1 Tax=Camellia sinensis TaxID=4442 RepID=UPI00103690D8|nr:beta-glucuronosyltransferase GlcAT14A-like isoform X2 [Camellia sinensis]
MPLLSSISLSPLCATVQSKQVKPSMANLSKNLLFSLLFISLLSLLLFLLPPPPSSHHHHHHHFSLPSSTSTFPPPPKIAYFISGTDNDGGRIFRLLKAIYHPRNHYLLHLDRRSSKDQRDELARMVASVPVFVDADNVNVIERANSVREEGPSSLALVLHGAAILLRSRRDWDWFVNLDASDYPLISQDDFLHVLSFAPRDFNFIEHTSNTSWKEYQRIMEVIVDPGLYLASKGRMFTGNKKRTLPNAYRFFTGSPHVILSRKLVEFAILGWDNLPRKLLLFFSNTKYSQRDYFQTLACNSKDFSKTVVNSNLRFTVYEDDPPDLSVTDLEKMLSSGAAFAGNFRANNPVLDKIDSLVLHRTAGMILPGGWCLGGRGRGRDPCQLWGDMSILRPGPASKKFEKLLLSLMSNITFHSNQCVR